MAYKKYKNFEIVTDKAYLSEEQITKGLEQTDKNGINHLTNYAYILHDKDVKKDGTPRAPHWHILIKMDNTYTFNTIAKRFGVEPQYVSKIKTRFANCLMYLTHNTPQAQIDKKYQYDDEEVKSNYAWQKERQKGLDELKNQNKKREIIELIDNNTMKEYNIDEFLSTDDYVKYKRVIDTAFEFKREKLLHIKDRELECIYLYGDSGNGKTTYAKGLARAKGYSSFVSSGSNDALDGYKGQECIIFDDLRPECYEISDLLKILDNHTVSSGKSRYHNKVLSECKLIIITTIVDIDLFYLRMKNHSTEPIYQLKRRCATKIKMNKNTISIRLFDEVKGDYGKEVLTTNPIVTKYPAKEFKNDKEYTECALSKLTYVDD